MKKILVSLVTFFIFTLTILACFIEDPNANTGDKFITGDSGNGSSTTTGFTWNKPDDNTNIYEVDNTEPIGGSGGSGDTITPGTTTSDKPNGGSQTTTTTTDGSGNTSATTTVTTPDGGSTSTTVNISGNYYLIQKIAKAGAIYDTYIQKKGIMIEYVIKKTVGSKQTIHQVGRFNMTTHGIWGEDVYEIHGNVTTPFTYQMEFHGFEGYESEKVTRCCFLYLDKTGRWKILRDIKNPKYEVTSNTGDMKAMFGKYSIQSTFGYKSCQILFVLAYFETANRSTHNLETLLNTTYTDPSSIPGVIRFGIIENTNPM